MTTSTRIRLGVFLLSIALGAAYWALQLPSRPAGRPFGSFTGTRTMSTLVDGVVRTSDGTPVPAHISILRASDAATGTRGNGQPSTRPSGVADSVDTDARGHFTVRRLPTADYLAVARVAGDADTGAHLWAVATFHADDRTARTLQLTLLPAASLDGRVAITSRTGATTPPFTDQTLYLQPASAVARAALIDGLPHALVDGDGSFHFTDLPPGDYQLQYSLPVPWSLDAATVAGRDVLDAPVTIATSARLTGAVISVTDRTGAIEGNARLADGRAAAFRLLLVYPTDVDLRGRPRRLQATRADATGRFNFHGLPTGAYFVVLQDDPDPTMWFATAALQRAEARATRVLVAPGPPTSLQVSAR